MIQLREISGKEFYLNSELIYRLDKDYDTIITLQDQKKIRVIEEPEEVVEKIITFRKKIYGIEGIES